MVVVAGRKEWGGGGLTFTFLYNIDNISLYLP